jgi:hypothetical protein
MFRSIAVLALVLLFPLASASQVRNNNLYVRNASPAYTLSADGKILGVSEVSETGQRWYNFMDLASCKWYPMVSIDLKNTFLTPDLMSAYSAELNLGGFKGNQEWLAYEKYLSWYHPTSSSARRNQWPDRNFIIAGRADGMVLTAGDLRFKMEQHQVNPTVTLVDINLTDPHTGKVISTVRRGKIMAVPYEWWNTRAPLLINNDNLLVWNDNVSWLQWSSLNIKDGDPISFYVPDVVDAFSGRFGMGVNRTSATSGNVSYLKFVVNMENGFVVHNEVIATKDALGYWCAAGPSNSFYTLSGLTSELIKETWNGEKFVVTKVVKLNTTDVITTGHWGSADEKGYQLIVSAATDLVLMLPKLSATKDAVISNVLLAWRLSDGQLTYKNPDFIKPYR